MRILLLTFCSRFFFPPLIRLFIHVVCFIAEVTHFMHVSVPYQMHCYNAQNGFTENWNFCDSCHFKTLTLPKNSLGSVFYVPWKSKNHCTYGKVVDSLYFPRFIWSYKLVLTFALAHTHNQIHLALWLLTATCALVHNSFRFSQRQ